MSGIVLVREALAAVLERKEYLLPTARNVGIREGTKTLLQAILRSSIIYAATLNLEESH